jgi:hypothetical protein
MKEIELRLKTRRKLSSLRTVAEIFGEVGVRIYANYKRTYEGKGFKWMLMYLFSRFYCVRRVLKLKARLRSTQRINRFSALQSNSLFTDLDAVQVVNTLRQKGCYIGLQLPAQQVDEICEFAWSGTAIANFDERLPFVPAEREQYEAEYEEVFGVGTLLDLPSCDAIEKIQRDPKLLAIAADYLKTDPIISCRLWWSFPAPISRFLRFQLSQEVFHYDTIDYNALKFFFYITPVNALNGPHICVLKSHHRKKLSHLWTVFIGRYEDQILEHYPVEDIVTIYGEAGTGFVEDPFCFHRATPILKQPRLMLEISCTERDFKPKK